MPRRKIIRTSDFPYHIVARTNNKVFFKLPTATVFDYFSTWLNISTLLFETQTHHFKLMSNHIHWILRTPQSNLDAIVAHLLTNVSKDINQALNTQDHVFGLRYQWSIIDKEELHACVVKYAYRNAVRAGICENVEDYPYSTLGFYFGIHPCPIWVTPDAFMQTGQFCEDPLRAEMFFKWLNTPSPSEDTEMIKKGLKRSRFEAYQRQRRDHYQIQDRPPF